MTDCTRRAALALGVGALGSVAGCVGHDGGTGTETPGSSPGNQRTPDAQAGVAERSFDHAQPLHRVEAAFAQRDVASYYLGLLTSADHAVAFPTARFENETAESFVIDTDFTRSAVVVLQDRKSSSHPDLELLDARRDGQTVTIEVHCPGSGATADVTTDTLLVRVPTDEGDLRVASAILQSRHAGPVRFSTRNSYHTVPEFDSEGGLVLRNRDCTTARLTVTVTYESDLFFRDHLELSPATVRGVAGVFASPGEWTVAVRRGEDTTARSWALTDGSAGDVSVDVAGDGTVSLSHHPETVHETALDTCEPEEFPYESSSPAENLDRPIDLWVLDDSDGAHRLTVTVRDDDRVVFSGEFDTRDGDDKVRRPGLLAKMTTYTVDVSMDGETTVSEGATVREGAKQLVVSVTESDRVRISLA
jgi:hypothetical protein